MASDKTTRYRVIIQDEAYDELDSVYAFICRDSATRAKAFVRALKSKILNLKTYPRRGTRVKILEQRDSPHEIRFVEHKGYLIFYTVHDQNVIVLHITGPGQDWMRIFG